MNDSFIILNQLATNRRIGRIESALLEQSHESNRQALLKAQLDQKQDIVFTVKREPPKKRAKQDAQKINIPPLSLFAESQVPEAPEPPSSNFAPFGRLIRCQLVITVDSSSTDTPIIGLTTHDVWHGSELVIPAGTEVHGTAGGARIRERITSSGQWTIVWQDGRELRVSGLALDREKNPDGVGWSITDGSAGLKGKVLKANNADEIKLFASTFLSGAASAFTEQEQTIFGTQATPSLNNAPLEGAQQVLGRYAQQIFNTIERDGFYVRIPAGKQFYLYVTETIDVSKAANGKHLTTSTE